MRCERMISVTFLGYMQGKEAEGMECYYRSLAIRRKALGTDHVSVATALYNIARSLRDQVGVCLSRCPVGRGEVLSLD